MIEPYFAPETTLILDQLEVFSRYLQQLVMESLGKRLDRNNKIVNQGLSVFGNKDLHLS